MLRSEHWVRTERRSKSPENGKSKIYILAPEKSEPTVVMPIGFLFELHLYWSNFIAKRAVPLNLMEPSNAVLNYLFSFGV